MVSGDTHGTVLGLFCKQVLPFVLVRSDQRLSRFPQSGSGFFPQRSPDLGGVVVQPPLMTPLTPSPPHTQPRKALNCGAATSTFAPFGARRPRGLGCLGLEIAVIGWISNTYRRLPSGTRMAAAHRAARSCYRLGLGCMEYLADVGPGGQERAVHDTSVKGDAVFLGDHTSADAAVGSGGWTTFRGKGTGHGKTANLLSPAHG